MPTPQEILFKYWGHQQFRGNQASIIDAVLHKKDVLALLPTGGGKSICFQIPAMLMDGVCIVVSPLIALMKDQVQNLQKRNIAAAAIVTGMSLADIKTVLADAVNNRLKFLYVSPERLTTQVFIDYASEMDVCLLAVDEAHCISQWGYDFRQAYQKIPSIKAFLPSIATIALTASATAQVQQDILQQLQLHEPLIFAQSFFRKNISYSLFNEQAKIPKLLQIVKGVKGSTIVYCNSRRMAKEVAIALTNNNLSADYYHAGLSQEVRNQKQQYWMNSNNHIMVCTNAFGMGIDKPNVRLVVHYNCPDCLENYYQEAGRAGRDEQKSYAVLLYDEVAMQQVLQNIHLKYPPIDVIKEVYQKISDYLQIAAGSGKDIFFNFNLPTFCSSFNVAMETATQVLRTLEQEGYIQFSEQIFIPSKIYVCGNRSSFRDIEENYPALDNTLKTVLRTYEGILTNEVPIYEAQIAKLSKQSIELITQHLQQLTHIGVLEYYPQKNTPQILFLHNKVIANDLYINQAAYFKRKAAYEDRLKNMMAYASSNNCRSQIINSYFGDNNTPPCGICDNCITKKRKALTPISVNQKIEVIKGILEVNAQTTEYLLQALQPISKGNFWQIITLLEQEKKIKNFNNLITWCG